MKSQLWCERCYPHTLQKVVLFYRRFYLIESYWGQRKVSVLFHSSVLVKELGIKPSFPVALSAKPHSLTVTGCLFLYILKTRTCAIPTNTEASITERSKVFPSPSFAFHILETSPTGLYLQWHSSKICRKIWKQISQRLVCTVTCGSTTNWPVTGSPSWFWRHPASSAWRFFPVWFLHHRLIIPTYIHVNEESLHSSPCSELEIVKSE